MKIKVNGVEIRVPVEGARVYLEDGKGIEFVEMDMDDAIEVLCSAVRMPAQKLGAGDDISYGRIWKMLDPEGHLSDVIGAGWVREICERMVKAGVLK